MRFSIATLLLFLAVQQASAQRIFNSLTNDAPKVYDDFFPAAFYETTVLKPGISRVFPVYERFIKPGYQRNGITKVAVKNTADSSVTVKEYDSEGFVKREQRNITTAYQDSGKTRQAKHTYRSSYQYANDRKQVIVTNTYTLGEGTPWNRTLPTNSKEVYVFTYGNDSLLQQVYIARLAPANGDTLNTVSYACRYDSLNRLAQTSIVSYWNKDSSENHPYSRVSIDNALREELYTYKDMGITNGNYVASTSYIKEDSAYKNIMARYIPYNTVLQSLYMFDDHNAVLYHYMYNDSIMQFRTEDGYNNEYYRYARYPEKISMQEFGNHHAHDFMRVNSHVELSVYKDELILHYTNGRNMIGVGHAGWSDFSSNEHFSLYLSKRRTLWTILIEGDLEDHEIEYKTYGKSTASFIYRPNGLIEQVDYKDKAGKKHSELYSYNQQ